MIKGINKQIIELKCTDEYFDKVLLFVRADRAGTPESVLKKSADNYCCRVIGSGRRVTRLKGKVIAASIVIGICAAAAAYILVSLM